MLRCDTLGGSGAFSLRWCDQGHNGGLNAGAPGPSFLVNTDRGCLRAWAPRPLPAGEHHLVGTYDGEAVRLFADGVLLAERRGRGRLVRTDLPVTVGRIQDGAGRFRGRMVEARVQGPDR